MGQIRKSQIPFSFEKNGDEYVWKVFATWNELFTRLFSVRGLNTTGRKTELVPRVFAAFEMKLPIIVSSEKQQKKLKLHYKNQSQKFNI